MAKNLEIKLKMESFTDVLNFLKNIGATDEGILNQIDVYYQMRDGLLKLRVQNGENTLIKYNRDESGNDRWSNYDILRLSGEEVEKFFKGIFNVEIIVDKERQLYLYKDTRIHLDTVKNLGLFLELETVVTSSLDYAKELFNEMMKILKLDSDEQILSSYRDLMLRK